MSDNNHSGQLLSEYFGSNDQTAEVRVIYAYGSGGSKPMYEVLWNDKSVGMYQTEQEADNVAENYALGSAVSRT
tara:strand:+ start:55 stop:276 length:222 start_codon:yes stop_codon:yes gene_type:complete